MKITSDELVKFELEYFNVHTTKYHNLRYGQAFMNTFFPSEILSSLFYEESVDIARSYVWMNCVT